MIESILISAITVAIGGLITYGIVKKLTNVEYILEISDVLLDEITQNIDMQKKVYSVGVLFGNGIKTGVGLTKGKGKFKLDDIVAMGVSHFLGKIIGGQKGSEPSSTVENLLAQ